MSVVWDHLTYVIGLSLFSYYNYKGLLWVSAAEGFVIISGLLIGYIFLNRKTHCNIDFVRIMLKRTFVLYLISVLSSIILTIFFWKGNKLEVSGIWRDNHPEEPDFFLTILYSILFIHHYGWMDIFVLYVWLFIITIPIVLIIRKYRLLFILVLILSFSLWLFDQIFRLELNLIQVSSFRLLSWQFLFIVSLVLGMYFERLRYFYKKRILRILVIITFVVFFVCGVVFPYNEIDFLAFLFSKEFLAVGRLILSFFWLYAVGVILRMLSDKFNLLANLLSYIGKESLYVYAIHALVLVFLDGVFIEDFFLNSLVVIVITIFIYFLVFLKNKFFNKNRV